MGGPSVEHEVSLATGWEMLKNLDTEKYKSRTVVITGEKSFYYTDNIACSYPGMTYLTRENHNALKALLSRNVAGNMARL